MDLFQRPEHDPPVPEPWMKRNLKLLLVCAALAASLVLTVTHRDPHRFTDLFRFRVEAGEPLQAATPPQSKDKKYDLSALRIFNATLMRINDSYVDPTRVDPKQMLLASLDYVQKGVAEVMVEPHAADNKVIVRVDTVQKEFGIGEVDSPWTLSLKM